jgi:hypothetical protein
MPTSTELQTSSETTGFRKLGSALESALGQLAGGTGSGERRNAHGLPTLPPIRASEVRPVALLRDPAELLPPRLRASLGAAQWSDIAPGDAYGADLYAMGYNTPAVVDAAATTEAKTFVSALQQTCRPLDDESLIRELAKLRTKVGRRAEEGSDMELLFEAYVEDLREYPADIVLEVLRTWPNLSKWWPALEELKQPIGWRVRQRAGFLAALEAVANRGSAAP